MSSRAAAIRGDVPSTDRARNALRAPPGLPTLTLFVGAAIATLWAYSMPGQPGLAGYVFLVVGWAGLGGYWVLRLIGALLAGRRSEVLHRWIRWLLPPVIVLVTAGLVITWVPLRARMGMSMGAMNELARLAMRSPGAEFPDSAGLFPVKRVEVFDGGMRFLVTGEGAGDDLFPALRSYSLDTYGFAYSPSGRPPRIGEDSYLHIDGPWYLWEQSW